MFEEGGSEPHGFGVGIPRYCAAACACEDFFVIADGYDVARILTFRPVCVIHIFDMRYIGLSVANFKRCVCFRAIYQMEQAFCSNSSIT